MEATEFYELLNEYPVVRKADYCSDSWIEHNNIYVHSKNLSTSNSDTDMKNDDIQEISTTDSSQDFYTQLDEYLSANHLSGKKQAILSSFKQNLSQIVDSLNLEDIGDIERLADQCQ